MSDENESERPDRERPSNAADRRGRRASGGSGGSGADGTPAKGRATPSRAAAAATKEKKVSPIGRIVRFLREVVAELRKVIWPNRSQMVKYTIAVLIFVSFMVTLVFLLDSAFAEGVAFLFGRD
ncbi:MULTISPECIES: preprotein translocase subunit SecE [Pseudonocardia]|uniref:Protein translocase subunit SecE n=2 Tax=Pseudonocardia TaxID=1847 RepID=A0A1Y2N0L3_PSEAH|nr:MULTISPECIES: preprotein translocase subunit SecE [Pseudonocardia]OSY40942.1 preprotein translocase subunit SecE [Pseudonocardia autotrophica]TDN73928.1 protein translocase subunit secE/sec61 gamma [Pseudonocardia autotrophica]BBG04681.1 protein translocase subunit SecE [Pseudonocardia autotrophica]GEC28778.1 protein translocase subunit SecE [Pseudonocardia saturnea]